MNLTFKHKKITGILTVLPKNEVKFEDEMSNYHFSESKALKLKVTMGYNKHHIVEDGVSVSDLCTFGLEYLFNQQLLAKDDIDALVLVTQSPDYFMPPTSSVIQGRAGLKQDIICMDINQGCSGYIIGLIQSFLLLDQPAINKVALLNADILSRKVSKKDHNSNPLIGDAASITIVEKSDSDETIHCNIKMDGTRYDALIIPAGGFRQPSTPQTAIMEEDIDGNLRSKDNLVMKGDAIFNFMQTEVPPMVEEILQTAGVTKDEIDYYMFHQPNRFMLNKLADRLEVPREKMPSNVVGDFGNASGVSIPTVITYNLGDKLLTNRYKTCLAGFGVGLTWGSMIVELDRLKFSSIIYF